MEIALFEYMVMNISRFIIISYPDNKCRLDLDGVDISPLNKHPDVFTSFKSQIFTDIMIFKLFSILAFSTTTVNLQYEIRW